jgi:hypothetical protein
MMENRDVEEIEESEDDEEGKEREATSNHFTFSHMLSQGQQRPIPSPPLHCSASFSRHERRRSVTNLSNNPSVLRSFPDIPTRILDSKEASIIDFIVGEVRADINLDRIIEAAGSTFSQYSYH